MHGNKHHLNFIAKTNEVIINAWSTLYEIFNFNYKMYVKNIVRLTNYSRFPGLARYYKNFTIYIIYLEAAAAPAQ